MSGFNQLPAVYKIAVLLGARVEVFFKRENKWLNLLQVQAIGHKSKYRILEQDQNIFNRAKEMLDTMYTKVQYREYEYLVSNNALKPGEIILMEYGFGMYVQVQEDLTLKDLELEVAKNLLETNQQQAYYSQDASFSYGLDLEE